MLVLLPVQQQLRLKTTSDRSPFAGKYKLQFWVYVGVTGWEGTSAKVPDININIGGDKVSTAATVGLMWMRQFPLALSLSLPPATPGQCASDWATQQNGCAAMACLLSVSWIVLVPAPWCLTGRL